MQSPSALCFVLGSRGFSWRIHCGVEVTESSTNKQHTLSLRIQPTISLYYSTGNQNILKALRAVSE